MKSADFERVLGLPACARSQHFAVHYVAGYPSPPRWRAPSRPAINPPDTSTLLATPASPRTEPDAAKLLDPTERATHWVGAAVPKRHAARSVTRSLLKRQIRAAVQRQTMASAATLNPGLWVVRLRARFDEGAYHSAVSEVFRSVTWHELTDVLRHAAQRVAKG